MADRDELQKKLQKSKEEVQVFINREVKLDVYEYIPVYVKIFLLWTVNQIAVR